MKRAVAILLVLPIFLAAVGVWAGNAKKPAVNPMLVKKPPQTAEIAALVVPKPKQACPNWAWAAAVQLMLEQQQTTGFDQEYWVMKSAGGELCIEQPVDLERLKRWIDGEYVLNDGSHAEFDATITPGAPQDVSYFVNLLQKGRTAMVLWQGRPCVLKAIEYDEYIYPNGQRTFEARKLTIIDPLAKSPIVFDKTKDGIADLGGVFEVKVGPVDRFK